MKFQHSAFLLLLALLLAGCGKATREDEFTRLTNLGKSHLEKGEGAKAVETFEQALKLQPTLPDAQLNLANAFLRANRAEDALRQSRVILEVDPNSAAAHYVAGCALLRLGRNEEALKALQESQRIDPAVTAVNFQVGLAHERLGHFDQAIEQWQIAVEFEPEHLAAHYRLSQALLRLGRQDEANTALKKHQEVLAKRPNQLTDVATFEHCKHTLARLPFKPEEPLADGIQVKFTDATAAVIPNASVYRGPLGVLDLQHDGRHSLFVSEGDGFRLLINSNGVFAPHEKLLPGVPGGGYRQCLVGDLQNDRFEDALVLGEKGSHLFKFVTNAGVTEVTRFAGLKDLAAIDGVLVDFDFTGKLGLFALAPDGRVRVFRNLGSLYFTETGVTSGLPAQVTGARQILVDDWNGDDLLDVALARAGAGPELFAKVRGGPFAATNAIANLPPGAILASGDLNNDHRTDLVAATPGRAEIFFAGGKPPLALPAAGFNAARVDLIDFDNDGWLDLLASGGGVRLWRNLGSGGFRDVTAALGLDKVAGQVEFVAVADFDRDCDTDLALAVQGQGLKLLRNDGGNAHRQLKLRLAGNRSNASALGVRLELSAGGLRYSRTVQRLPVELGAGRHGQVDSVAVRWFDGLVNHDEIKLDGCKVLALEELQLPTGSCPYLYAWDGRRFRFVTDLLGASPLGLRVSDHRFVDADPVEYVRIGGEEQFPPRGSNYVLQVTEELREVLYLDAARLVVVDHPADAEVHTTGKLRPGKPFPPHELVTLHRRRSLLKAENHRFEDVTVLVTETDERMLSPTKLREPQLRGLAEPHGVTLDFGPLDAERPLVLALTGWLRFGGGMANVAASHHPNLPFPFPRLSVTTTDSGGSPGWQPVDVVVGAPAGKTKTILVDLTGKLPAGSRRLRLDTAFEIHWDRIALFEKRDNAETRVTSLSPSQAHLHGRGFSEFEDRSWQFPLTPDYERLRESAAWRITPAGWCTRYGPVDELVREQDNALALLNGGDELTLEFTAAAVPPKPAGTTRSFFFHSVGWDKDADFHCELGYQVEPLPWHGMDDQRYGREPRPAMPNDDWIRRYNTRWVGPHTVQRAAR
jgi:tetratricopeptide (TPR) repeat protein